MIKTSKEVILNASKEISLYQQGKLKPIKTRYKHFNENLIGGIYPGKIIVIAGIAQMGKTYFLNDIESDFFNEGLNPNANERVLLRCNWEMTVRDLLTNKLKSVLKVQLKDILFKQPTGDFGNKFRDVVRGEMDDKIYYNEEPTNALDWYNDTREFLAKFRKKQHILVTLDHLALVEGNVLKTSIDSLLGYANKLKKEFSNVSFVFISQLNRDIEYRTDIRFLAPIRSDLYASDAIYHIADIIVVKHIPFLLGHDKYMAIQTNDYKHLKKFMNNPTSTHSNFRTRNAIFYHYLKIRNAEDYMQRLHIDYLDENIEINDNYDKNITQLTVFD